jgi:hypothetical protein
MRYSPRRQMYRIFARRAVGAVRLSAALQYSGGANRVKTRDVDITLLTGLGGEESFVDPLLGQYRPRVADARRFALAHRVVLVETASRIPIDISLAGLPFEARVIDRSSPFDVEAQTSLTTCSAEDLVVLKAFAGRIQDWLDIQGVIVRQGRRLDRPLIFAELRPLLDLREDRETELKLQDLFAKHSV